MFAEPSRGLIASLNILLDRARAPLIARMDADDICLPERFARQFAFLGAQPDHGVIGSLTSDIDEYDRPISSGTPDQPLSYDMFLHNIQTGAPLLAHPSVMYRREVVRVAGDYHPAFRHCEDYDLWLRLANLTKIANLPERLLRYRHYPDQVSNRYALEQQVGVAISFLAHCERQAGRGDPTVGWQVLPPIEQLDSAFARPGVAREVRAHVARTLVYSHSALQAGAFELLLQHIREGGRGPELWRTALRLLRFGDPHRALRLTAALVRG